jgi:hypothetical protein
MATEKHEIIIAVKSYQVQKPAVVDLRENEMYAANYVENEYWL